MAYILFGFYADDLTGLQGGLSLLYSHAFCFFRFIFIGRFSL
jgi:hypothetical protein